MSTVQASSLKVASSHIPYLGVETEGCVPLELVLHKYTQVLMTLIHSKNNNTRTHQHGIIEWHKIGTAQRIPCLSKVVIIMYRYLDFGNHGSMEVFSEAI